MVIKLVGLDFDGVLTDIHYTPEAALEKWRDELSVLLNCSRDELNPRWDRISEEISKDKTKYGWKENGHIIAPAHSDPMVTATVISHILLDEEGELTNPEERQREMYDVFKRSQALLPNPFRPYAKETLLELRSKFELFIASNSDSKVISSRLNGLLGEGHGIPVYGDARKWILHNDWNEVPATMKKKDYHRLIRLRRRDYSELLHKIMGKNKSSPETTTVVGDIYELDLAVPEHHGIRTILVPTEVTAHYERAAVSSYYRGSVANDLKQVLKHLELDM